MKRVINLIVLITLLALNFGATGMTPASADQLLAPEGTPYTGCGGVASPPRTNTALEQEIFDLTNDERAAQGLPPLKRWDGLDQSAQYHAIDMAVDNYFDHNTHDRVGGVLQSICPFSATGSTLQRVRPFYFSAQSFVGENLVAGWSTPAEAIAAWMASPGHRANILSTDFRKMGVGYHYESGSDSGHYWVQNFGMEMDGTGMRLPVLIINQDEVSTSNVNVSIYIYGCQCGDEWQEMRLRNDSGAWGGWQPFQNSLSWTLDNTNGLRTVEAELKWNTDIVAISDTINYTASATHTVTFNVNGGTGTMTPQVASAPTALTLNAFTNAGYSFAGWGTDPGGPVVYADGAVYDFSADITLYAQWTPMGAPEIDVDPTGVNFGVKALNTNTDWVFTITNTGDADLTLTTPIAVSGADADQFSIQAQPSSPVAGSTSTTFTVRFTPTSSGQKYGSINIFNNDSDENPFYVYVSGIGGHTVTFDANGGTGFMAPQVWTELEPQGLHLNAFTNAGFSFAGWGTAPGGPVVYADGAVYDFSADITLYAQWTPVVVNHTVTFNPNGGSGTMTPQVASNPTALTLNAFTNPGYSFAGWGAAPGGPVVYANGAVYDFSADITLYAQWTPVNHTVTFNPNGGSGTMTPQVSNLPAALTLNAFTNAGYSFAGWGTAPGGPVVYADGAVYDFSADITLYAQWNYFLILPPKGSHLNSNSVVFFDWMDVPGAASYQLQASLSPNFTSQFINRMLSVSQYTHFNAPANRLVYWRVRSRVGLAFTPWSEVWTFTTANPPTVPVLRLPLNGMLVNGPSPLFDWANSIVPAGTTFDYYQFQVATDKAFNNIVYDNTIYGVTNSQDNTAVLVAGTTYYWRVRAFNTAGDYSAWSIVRLVRIR